MKSGVSSIIRFELAKAPDALMIMHRKTPRPAYDLLLSAIKSATVPASSAPRSSAITNAP
jgi:hypothetical protein